jgi:hypothetical protein
MNEKIERILREKNRKAAELIERAMDRAPLRRGRVCQCDCPYGHRLQRRVRIVLD